MKNFSLVTKNSLMWKSYCRWDNLYAFLISGLIMIKQTSAYSPSSFGLRFTLIAALSLANLLRNHSSKFRYEEFEHWTLRIQRLWIFEHSYVSALLSWRHSSRLPMMHPIAIAASTPYLHREHRNRLHIPYTFIDKALKISFY